MNRQLIVLPQGARLVLDPMPQAHSVSIGLWMEAGTRDEPADQIGLAHLLEHMAFKGGAGRDARALAEAVEARGAELNAATGHERTGYYVRGLAEDAAFLFDILADMVLVPDLPEAELAKEKDVVLQELAEAHDTADDWVFELSQRAAFGDTPIGRSILGDAGTLERISRADLAGFLRAGRAPERLVVVASGAFEPKGLAAAMAGRLATLNNVHDNNSAQLPARLRTGFGAVPADARVQTDVRRIDQMHQVLSRGTVDARHPDRFAARLFAEILGGGMASRLFQSVREELGLAYSIYSSIEAWTDAGQISVYAASAPEKAAAVLGEVNRAWESLATHGPKADELARAKAILRAQFLMGQDSPGARSSGAAYELLMHGSLIELDGVLSALAAVSPEDVRAIAASSLNGPGTCAAIGPKAGLKSLTPLARGWASLKAAPKRAAIGDLAMSAQ
jgi:predicted Zn-dependent peptidase